MKEKRLTDKMRYAIDSAEETLFGDIKLVVTDGRTINALATRGLVEGSYEHAYLTADGKAERSQVAI